MEVVAVVVVKRRRILVGPPLPPPTTTNFLLFAALVFIDCTDDADDDEAVVAVVAPLARGWTNLTDDAHGCDTEMMLAICRALSSHTHRLPLSLFCAHGVMGVHPSRDGSDKADEVFF